MKKLIIVFFLFSWSVISAQKIDLNHFDEKKLNNVIFAEMQEFSKIEGVHTLLYSSIGGQRIYRYIKRNHRRMKLDDINLNLNGILREYDSEFVRRSGSVGSLGILDSVSTKGVKTYQELANTCITGWKSSPADYFFMEGWGIGGEAFTYYDRRTEEVYIFFAFLR